MLRKLVLFGLLITTAFAFQVEAAPLLLPERTVACEEEPFVTQLRYGDHTTGCAINQITDRDTLTFDGVSGDYVKIVVVSTTSNMDPRLQLRGPGGTIIEDGACNNKGCFIMIEVVLPDTGPYFIILSDGNINETGGYQVQLEKIPPTQPPLSISLPYEFPGEDKIDTVTDVDFIAFEGTANTEIQFTVVSTSTNMDPQLVIRDPNGDEVFSGFCANKNCSISEPLVLTLSGFYLMELHDRKFNEKGDYLVEINCTFPPDGCPDDLDRDTITDSQDNCIRVANRSQEDMDSDDLGDLCDADLNNDGLANQADLGVFADNYGYIDSGIIPHEGDFDMDEDSDGVDLDFLIDVGVGTFGPSGFVK